MAETVDEVLAGAARGDWPAPVALLRLMAAPGSEDEARRALDAALARDAGHLHALDRLWRAHPTAFGLVRSVLARADHAGIGSDPARWQAVFDALADTAPDAAMALYALGDPDLLAAATLEVVDLVQAWADLRPGARVLDLGCGTGRVAGALLAKGMEVIGLDVSGRMLAVARGRHPGLLLAQVPGQDLACVRSGSVDAVLAVDVMPYLTRAGGSVAGAMMRDIARVLRPGGTAVILNWSYDDAQAGPLEVCEALSPLHGPEQPFRLWDARAWALRATR